MHISRRGILRGLFAAPAVIAASRLMPVKAFDLLDPVQTVPPIGTSRMLTPEMIAREALKILEENLGMQNLVRAAAPNFRQRFLEPAVAALERSTSHAEMALRQQKSPPA